MQPNPQQMTPAEIRSELAKRIRDRRMVSHYNDPKRTWRDKMNQCRKEKNLYHRLTGFPWTPKS